MGFRFFVNLLIYHERIPAFIVIFLNTSIETAGLLRYY